jgi:hypothetical protein
MFLYCGMRLVGIIGYHLTVSLPPRPTSPKIGFAYETGKFRQGSGGFCSSQCKLHYVTTQPQSSGDDSRDQPGTGSIASDAEGDATASYSCDPRKFSQVPELTVPDNFDESLTDAQIAPWASRAEPTH